MKKILKILLEIYFWVCFIVLTLSIVYAPIAIFALYIKYEEGDC